MGKQAYKKALELIKKLNEVEFISEDDLKSLIMRHIGGDYRTINTYLDLMQRTRLIEKAHGGYKLCLTKTI